MAQLYYRYGTMNSGKSIEILKVAYNYEEQGKPVVLMTSGVDNRSGQGIIASRIGLKRRVQPVMDDTNIYNYVKNIDHHVYCVLIDEAQFLTKQQVYQLSDVVDKLKIPVLCYGLRTDFQAELFEGSKYLLAWADQLEELKTICYCGRKANFVLRLNEQGEVIKEGEQIQIGGNDSYLSVCRYHYKEKCGQL